MYADNEPLQLGDSYYPLDIMQGSKIMDEADVIEGTDQVLEDLGHTPSGPSWRPACPPLRRGCPMNLRPIVLTGHRVRLEPLAHSHAEELLQAAAHDEIWTYLDKPTPRAPDDIKALITDALREQENGTRLPFAIISTHTGQAVGSTSYIDVRPADRTVEIGWTWITPSQWGSGVNTEATYLLLELAFEEHRVGRVAMKADARNLRSQRAITKIGAVREGVWRNHRLLSTGHYRDSVYFSVIDSEWPSVRAGLQSRLTEARDHSPRGLGELSVRLQGGPQTGPHAPPTPAAIPSGRVGRARTNDS
jgi:RimJ/RimL family protein N-acetyltransferase